MTIFLSWAAFELSLVDADADREFGIDVLKVSCDINGSTIVGFFECGASCEVWERVRLGVKCLKEMCLIEEVEISVVK